MWPVLWQEFKHKRVGLIAYTAGALSLLILYVSVFPTIQHSAEQFQKLLQAYPKEFLKAFGIENLTFDTLEKYLGAEQYSFVWPIMAVALALSRAGSSVAGEIERGTMGLLLALPLRRSRLLAAKYLAGLAAVLIFTTISVLGVIPIAGLGGVSVNLATDLRSWVLASLFLWAVFACAMALSALFSERSRVYVTASAGLLAMYVMNVVAGIEDKFDWLKYGSFFYYFNIQEVLRGNPLMSRSLLVFGGVIVVATILAFWRFGSRDIAV
jgi:ABC-2 type transport system permease protein